MCSQCVVHRKCEGIAKRVIYMSLCCEMHHCIHLLTFQDMTDKVGTQNVAVNEFEIWQSLDSCEVIE